MFLVRPTCQDCGAILPQGTTDCQKLFDELLAREFGDYRYARLHRLTVDTLRRVQEWARSTWAAWSSHHAIAREWIAQATASPR